MAYKPPKYHPWRKFVKPTIHKWARDKSTDAKVNSNKVGGGLPPWNGDK